MMKKGEDKESEVREKKDRMEGKEGKSRRM